MKPHFHSADQYQVIVQGGGRLGVHDVGTVSVHYTDSYSAYGPIVAAGEGISWFTLRNAWDPGARYMPADAPATARRPRPLPASGGDLRSAGAADRSRTRRAHGRHGAAR